MQLEGTEPPAWETALDTALFAQVVRSLPPGSLPPRVIPCGCPVRGDRALLVDLLRNLTLNAQKACQGIVGALTANYRTSVAQSVSSMTPQEFAALMGESE